MEEVAGFFLGLIGAAAAISTGVMLVMLYSWVTG